MTSKQTGTARSFPSSGPLGVCVLPPPDRHRARSACYPQYIHEILSHAGVCSRTVAFGDLGTALDDISILLTVGEAEFPAPLRAKVRSWVRKGGLWISIGGVCGLEELFGVEQEAPAYKGWGLGMSVLGEGYLSPAAPRHPIISDSDMPLHFFGGLSVKATSGTLIAGLLNSHQHKDHRAGIVENRVGRGRTLLIAADVTGTVVRIQQGTAVTRDGVPAPDGTASRNELALKCDDGIVLDWVFDRQPVPSIDGLRAFLRPIADRWREIVLRSIFHLARSGGVPLPVLWLYPRNLPMLAHMSHDSDLNEPDKAHALLDVLERLDIHSTWCIQLPGYRRALHRAIAAAGHELAIHFDALDEEKNPWSEKEFQRQMAALRQKLDGVSAVTNKNHYTIWQGDTEFYEWCSRAGIRLDQTKGPSKTGEAGFPFGTCHPYLSVAPDGSMLDVLELPFQTQDLEIFVPGVLCDALLPPVLKHHGILHLLFHPAHVCKPGVADALSASVQKAMAAGAEWWTATEIDKWERARRQAKWTRYERSRRTTEVELRAASLEDATILWLHDSRSSFRVNGHPAESVTVERWGFEFQALNLGKAKKGYHLIEAVERK